jgi:hypothetical protein
VSALNRANRALQLGVASYAGQAWYLSFAVPSGGPFARVVPDPALAGNPTAVFSGTNGGWAAFAWVPTAEVRVKAGSNLTSTVSFCLVEINRYG